MKKILTNTILQTKDGRMFGNAICTGRILTFTGVKYMITTDYGEKIKLFPKEVRECFYIGTVANFTHKNFKTINK